MTRRTRFLIAMFIIGGLIAVVTLTATPAHAQERPKLELGIELQTGSLTTTFGGTEFVPQRSEPLNKMLNVRINPVDRLSLSFRTDLDGRINAPTFKDAQGRDVVKQYDEYAGRDRVMEVLVGYRAFDALELDIYGGYSVMKHTEDYVTGQNVGLPPLRTTSERKFSGIVVGVGSSHEWERVTFTGKALVYPRLTRNHTTTQDYQGLHFETKMDAQDGWGMDFRLGLDVRVWENISASATYQWRQVRSHRASAQSAATALLIDEKTRGQYLGFSIGVRF